jgi:hypothetical protein
MLDRDLSSFALSVGDQTNLNHQDCPAGQDTKKRLYVRRTNEGYVWYCHHCSQGGFQRGGTRSIHKKEVAPSAVSLPADFDPNHTNWPEWAKDFQIQGWGFSGRMGRVVIPVYGSGELLGYQARAAPGQQPKYLTKGKGLVYKVLKNRPSICIVEDALSAERVGEVVDAAACLGSDMSTDDLVKLAKGHTQAYVWLDNDNPTVRKNQRRMIERLSLIIPTKGIVTDRDPKHYSKKEIQCLLK